MLAGLDFRLELAGDVQRDLGVLVLHMLDRFGPAAQADFARLAVDRRTDVLFMPVLRAASLLDGLLHGFEHFLAVDVLLAGYCIGNQQQFGTCNRRVHQIGPPASMRRVITFSPASSDSVWAPGALPRHLPLRS